MDRKAELHKIEIILGKRIRHFRKKYRFSLVELSERVGISSYKIYRYENAQSKLSAAELYRIAQIFRINTDSLYGEALERCHSIEETQINDS